MGDPAVFLLSQVLFFKSFALILKVDHSQSELFLFLDGLLVLRCFHPTKLVPYYGKLTLVLIKVLEITQL